MPADVTTANTIGIRTGTNWTINVTATNLDKDLSVKDFIILHNNVLVDTSPYVKTSRTLLTYNGAALPADTTVEVRRKTPVAPVSEITYGSKFSSALWNAELERTSRWKAETEVNGAGISGIGIPIPKDDAFGATWASDIIYPPTRKSVYDKIITMPTLASAPFTVNPTVPDIVSRQSGSAVPNTKYIDVFYAAKDSPILTGNPTAPTRAQGDNTTGLATTAFVLGERTLLKFSTAGTNLTVARSVVGSLNTASSFVVPTGYTHMTVQASALAYVTVNDASLAQGIAKIQMSVNGGAQADIGSGGFSIPANSADNYIPIICNGLSTSLTAGTSVVVRLAFSYLGGANATKTFNVDSSLILITLHRSSSVI